MFRDLVPVAADRHRTPAALSCARSVVEKEAAFRIGADSQRRLWSLENDFCSGAGNSCKEPFERVFACHELQCPAGRTSPPTTYFQEFIMAVGQTQNQVDGIHPNVVNALPRRDGLEGGTQ